MSISQAYCESAPTEQWHAHQDGKDEKVLGWLVLPELKSGRRQ